MSREDLSELLDSVDMEYFLDREGVSYRLTYGSGGTQLNVRECPVCGHTGWKVFMNAESGAGNCFAGDHPEDQRTFGKFHFIGWTMGTSGGGTVEYLKTLAREVGWQAKRVTSAAVELEKPDLKIPRSYELPIKGKNLRYLEERGIDLDTARYFHLRYCHKGWFKYPLNGEEKYQPYHGRIVIPVFDMAGELVSFQGRDITGTAGKKYLFPPGFASTGTHIYNGHNAHRAARVVVGEGAFDVMALKVALDGDVGLRDVVPVGTFGKHLSHGRPDGNDQLSRFLELRDGGMKEVTFMWDGEPKALIAAAEAGTLLQSRGIAVRIGILPPGKDPNEVPPHVVRATYWGAKPLTKQLMVRLRLGMTGV